MGYLVLARKWRPQKFEDLQGQEAIIKILRNAVTQSKIAHAYLFSGPRGVGKTSTARILAKSLNCIKGPTAVPCGKCTFCTSITEGSSVDVIEIDGASNNSVDDIRDLREKVKYAPSGGRYKVYIIDEAHMLSQSAFNALLKTLEEPPPHVVFVLATTASNKIPITVLSRCQHLPFKRIPSQIIRERLWVITSEENISISERALELLARTADGSMRDALTLLDQVSAFSDEISEDDLMSLLGISDSAMVIDMVRAILEADRKAIISLCGQIYDKGQDSREFIRSLISFLRDLLVSKVLGGTEGIIDIGEEDRNRAHDLLARASEEHLTLLLDALVTAENEIRVSAFPRVALEMILLKTSFLSRFRNIGELLKKLPSGDLGKEPAVQKGPQTRVRKVPEDTVQEGEACRMTPESTEEKDLWSVVLKKVDEKDHVLACKLSHASAELEGDDLTIIFNGGFSVHADAVTENKKLLEEVATESAARKIRVAVQTKKKQGEDIKEKILNDPFVRDTLELFDGRIIDIRPKNSKQR